jgi:hypothetical protein
MALFLLLMALPAHCFEYHAGAVGGVNVAGIDLKYSDGTDRVTSSRTTFGMGGVLGLKLKRNVLIEVQPMYLRKGGTDMADRNNPNIDFNLSYLEVPVLVKVMFGEAIRPYVICGPTFGIRLGAEAEAELGGVLSGGNLRTYTADLDDVTKSYDFGLGFGAGVSVALKMGTLFLDGRYTFGLVDLFESGLVEWKSGDEVIQGGVSEEAELGTRGFTIMVGITLPLGEMP